MTAYLPLFPIFLDAAVTLVRRWRRGAALAQAHREHLYQRLANEAGWGHARVAALYAAAAVAALPAAWRASVVAVAVYFVVVTLAGWTLDRMARVQIGTTGTSSEGQGSP